MAKVDQNGPADNNTFPQVPVRRRGRKSPDVIAAEHQADLTFARAMENLSSSTGYQFGPRGWGYYLEGIGYITKAELDVVEALIVRLRKEGILDPDIVPDDNSRASIEGEPALDTEGPQEYAQGWVEYLKRAMGRYYPISFWDGLSYYVEVAVEKKDLLQIFGPICRQYNIQLTNMKGDSDLNSRRHMLNRMGRHQDEGRTCVLLYWGDHDPKGLSIAKHLKSNLIACEGVQGVTMDASAVEVIRAGLTRQQIDDMDLLWIDNLITGSGKDLANPRHPDHSKPYVENYIETHGIRKVEANAIVADPAAAERLLYDLIVQYVPEDWPDQHRARLEPMRKQAIDALARLIQ